MMDLVKTNFKTAIERLHSFPSDQLNKSHVANTKAIT
jgi:hypothetical protein